MANIYRRVIENWYEALNENEYIDACFLNKSKHFEMIYYDHYDILDNEI